MKRSTLKATAYHEAGHAVADLRLHNGIRIVTIIPDKDQNTLGHCIGEKFIRNKDKWETGTRNRLRMERRVISMLAGHEAQSYFSPNSVRYPHAGADRSNAFDLIDYFTGSPEESDAYYKLLEVQARHFVRFPQNWTVIVAVAKALLSKKTLSGKDVRRIAASVGPYRDEDRKKWEADFKRRMKAYAKPGKGGRG